jgi:hypothetical protein
MGNSFNKMLIAIVVTCFLTGCTPGSSDVGVSSDRNVISSLVSGDEIFHSDAYVYSGNEVQPQVALTFAAKKKQPLNASFDIYPAARQGFLQDWEEDVWKCNPGYGKFAVEREISDENGKLLRQDYYILDGFPSDGKFVLDYQIVKGQVEGMDDVVLHFTDYIVNTFDFSSLDVSKGKIAFFIVYFDDRNNQPFETNVYQYGIDWGDEAGFEISGEEVTFSSNWLNLY